MSFTAAQTDYKLPPYSIPNTMDEDNDNTLSDYIAREERKVLLKLLGSSLYTSLTNGLAVLPADWVGANNPGYAIDAQVVYGNSVYKSLVDNNLNNIPVEGAEWTLVDGNNKWLLLKNGDTYEFMSKEYRWVGLVEMLVPYIYYKWLTTRPKQFTGLGVTESKSENGNVINGSGLMSEAYNDYSCKAGAFLNQRDSLYGYLKSFTTAGTFDDSFDSSFDNMSAYLNFVFKDPRQTNRWNL